MESPALGRMSSSVVDPSVRKSRTIWSSPGDAPPGLASGPRMSQFFTKPAGFTYGGKPHVAATVLELMMSTLEICPAGNALPGMLTLVDVPGTVVKGTSFTLTWMATPVLALGGFVHVMSSPPAFSTQLRLPTGASQAGRS